jgi:hypothetical protein
MENLTITLKKRGRPKKDGGTQCIKDPKPPKVKKTEDRKTYMKTYMSNYMKNLDEAKKKEYLEYQKNYRYKHYDIEKYQTLKSKMELINTFLEIKI